MKPIAMAILMALTAGCVQGNGDTGTSGQKQAGLLDGFIIMAYCGPPPGEVTLERYREIADAGIDFLVPANGTVDAEQNLKAMELGAQVGVGIIPVDLRLFPFELKPDMEVDAAVIKEIVDSYKGNPGLASYVVKDEPNTDLFPVLREICDIFRAEDPAHEPLINLFPSYGSPLQLGIEDYREYIRTYLGTVKPDLLAYDYYALRESETVYDGWFSDLSIVREETRKAGVPFLVFIQSEGIKGYLRVPNRAEVLWQVNTALAYGAQGIGWFCYWTPEPDQGFQQAEGAQPPLVEAHYNAMIDANGKRTKVYGHVREANQYIKKAGEGLLGWDNTEVARYEAGSLLSGGASPVAIPSGDDANILIGTFRKGNRVRLVVSNGRCDKPTRVSLHPSPGWKPDKVFTSIAATPRGDKASLLEWSMEPGGSILIDLMRD